MDFAQKFGTVDSNAKFIARIKEMEANAVKIDDYETNPFIRLSKAVYDKHPEHVEAAIRDELGISGEISLEGVDLAALASGYPNCGPNDIVDSWDLSEVSEAL